MSYNKKHEAFIESTLQKLQTELQKFIINTNYSNSYSISVYQKLNSFKNKLKSNHQILNTDPIPSINISSFLPQIKQSNHPLHINHPTSIYNLKHRNSNYRYQIQTMSNVSPSKSVQFNLPKNNKLKEPISNSVSMNSHPFEKYLKYSSENKNKNLYHEKIHDELNFPIIRNKEMKQGLLDMIYQGYIPKNADLTPAFNQNGNSFSITNDELTKRNYCKSKLKDDISNNNSSFLNIMKFKINEDNNVMKLNKKRNKGVVIDKENISNKQSCIFLTENSNEINEKNEDTKINNNVNIQDSNTIITFNEGKVMKNKIYTTFLKKNKKNKKSILFIINNLLILLNKLKIFSQIHIDTSKILQLLSSKPKFSSITNKDLLLCLSEESLHNINLDPDNLQSFIEKLQNIFAIKIQTKFRQYLSFMKSLRYQYELDQIIKIQSWFRQTIISSKIKQILLKYREDKQLKYNSLISSFKEDWAFLTESPRVEIHINSYSFSNYKNTTIYKYPDKENLQLNRLIRLIDPNLEMIYISPINIDEDIFRYYFSILNSIGISNIEKRFHFIVPETSSIFPPHYSLSQLLFLSTKTQNKIKHLIHDKNAYIVPGIISSVEKDLSFLLECPILMGNFSQTELLCNKSGCKNVFESNEIPFPISAWDIHEEEEFYSSLANLMSMYRNINIWIFKINNETSGRGIAYINISTVNELQQLLHNKYLSQEVLKEKLFLFLSASLSRYVTIVNTNIYPTWKEYLTSYLQNKGIIESCPTFDLNDIVGNPTLPILIEPDGKIKVLPTFDKININNFQNVLCTSPQKSLPDIDMNGLGEKIGMFLYKQNVIGYVTIEFIAFKVDRSIKYWGIDMKFGLSDYITSLQFSYFVYIRSTIQKGISLNNINQYDSENGIEIDIDYGKIIDDALAFIIPVVVNDGISDLMLSDFLSFYKYKNVVFDIEKREGVIFNFPNSLQRGIFGICGIVNLDRIDRFKGEENMWKNMEKCLDCLGMLIRKYSKVHKKKEGKFGSDERRNDCVDLYEIYAKVKRIIKKKGY